MQRVALGTTTAGRLVIKTPQRLPLLQQVRERLSWTTRRKDCQRP